MAKKKVKKKVKSKTSVVKEPAAHYGRGELKFFNSFEEADEDDILQTLKQTPAERIRETVELILRVYGFTRESLKKRRTDNIIYFNKSE